MARLVLAPFVSWHRNRSWPSRQQRCLAHPEIHYRPVSRTHLDAALQPQITTNDLPLSLSLHPLPTTFLIIHLSSSFHYFSLPHLCCLFSFTLSIVNPAALLPLHPALHVKYCWPCRVPECKVQVFIMQVLTCFFAHLLRYSVTDVFTITFTLTFGHHLGKNSVIWGEERSLQELFKKYNRSFHTL